MYTSQQKLQNRTQQIDLTMLLDPALLKAARQIYRAYYEVHTDLIQPPLGVAINRYNFRGKVIFSTKPILLPQECFVPFHQIESEIY